MGADSTGRQNASGKAFAFGKVQALALGLLLIACTGVTPCLAEAQVSNTEGPIKMDLARIELRQNGQALPVSLKCPRFVFETQTVGEQARAGDASVWRKDGVIQRMEPTFMPLALADGARMEVKLHLEKTPGKKIVLKWASFRVTGLKKPLLLKEVILEDLDPAQAGLKLTSDQAVVWPPQSYPILLNGFFMGIEFPIASTRLEAGRIILAHQPGLRVQPDTWYETRKAVYGIVPPGRERLGFQQYIMAHSPGELRRMIIWNIFFAFGRFPYDEADVLKALKPIDEHFVKSLGATADAYMLDYGWSEPKSIYGIKKDTFPNGFTKSNAACEAMGGSLGIWVSPSSNYPQVFDREWAKTQGYETFPLPHWWPYSFPCLAGKKYQGDFKKSAVKLWGDYNLGASTWDGMHMECPSSDHGHEPGKLSSEAIANGLIDILQAIHQVAPKSWITATCTTQNASPWWLFYFNSVIGSYGDDVPSGRVPHPDYLESHTTARDFFNLQGVNYNFVPPALTETFAGLHNITREPFVNEAVVEVLRGNLYYTIWTNPLILDDSGWKALAEVCKWGRQPENLSILMNTQALLPPAWVKGKVPLFTNEGAMPREPYGYAHWQGERGLVMLRNPWIMPQTYALKLDATTDLSPQAAGLSAVSLYPENRLYGKNIKFGDTLEVALKPYETLVLSIDKNQPPEKLPENSPQNEKLIETKILRQEAGCVVWEKPKDGAAMGPNWTCLVGEAGASGQLKFEAEIVSRAPQAELLVLSEEKADPFVPLCEVKINGKKTASTLSGPDTGYTAAGGPRPEQWLFLRYPLKSGKNRVSLELLTRGASPKISVWAWAHKKGTITGSTLPNSLPQPEVVSLDATEIIKPLDMSTSPTLKITRLAPPLERIKGIYLDALDPTTATVIAQQTGVFLNALEPPAVAAVVKKNKDASDRPLNIYGRRFLRGLGTVAPSKIVYALDGKYRRFQSWVGAAENSTCGQAVRRFEVWVDGKKKWDSGPMTRWDKERRADVDVRGGKTLTLIAADLSDELAYSPLKWANWAEARLLK